MESRWPHRLGEALRRLGRVREAEEAFVRATEAYGKQGFLPRAIAMAKLVTAMNPAQGDLLARLQAPGTKALRAHTPLQRAVASAAPPSVMNLLGRAPLFKAFDPQARVGLAQLSRRAPRSGMARSSSPGPRTTPFCPPESRRG